MTDFDPVLRGNRADWRNSRGFEAFQERERARIGRAREQYQASLVADCQHGRRRVIGETDGRFWAALECRTGACGIKYVPAALIYGAWRDGGT